MGPQCSPLLGQRHLYPAQQGLARLPKEQIHPAQSPFQLEEAGCA